MSVLSRFARSKATEVPALPELPKECSHWELAPRWDNAADMGKKGKVTSKQVREIAEFKLKDMNAFDVEAAMKSIAGTARSMGLDVID